MGYKVGYSQGGAAMAQSAAMARKLSRPEVDIVGVAAELAASWHEADGVESWLRTHVARLTRMAQDESWAWADIARALMQAGIRYRSGRPWTGTLLLVKAAQVRAQRRQRARARAAAELAEDAEALKQRLREASAPSPSRRRPAAPVPPRPNLASVNVRPAVERPAAMDEDALEPPGPEFRPAKPIGWTPRANPGPDAPNPSPPSPDVDVQEVLERFLNKPKR